MKENSRKWKITNGLYHRTPKAHLNGQDEPNVLEPKFKDIYEKVS